MGRRAEEPLEKKDVILFQGDWDRLREILASAKITPTQFIRALVRKKIREIEARVNDIAKTGPEVSHDELDLDLDSLSGGDAAQDSEPDQS